MAIRRDGMISFNPYVSGDVIYGNGTTAPTSGPVDKTGYRERDQRQRVRRNALLAYQQAGQAGQYGSANFQRKAGS